MCNLHVVFTHAKLIKCRGRSISSLLVLVCGFHLGVKRISTIVGLTHGKTREGEKCQKEPYMV